MKRKNFTSIPNEFFIDETKTNKLDLDYRHEYVFIKMQACQSKWGQNFQKSQQLMANICNMSKSTFIRIVTELINKGIVTKNVIQVENSKESESCYWTVNYEYEFQIETTPIQEETTPIQNDNGVLSEWQGGIVNMTKKEDVLKDFKKDFKDDDIYSNPKLLTLLENYLNCQEINSMGNLLTEKGFNHDTIKEIQYKTAIKITRKEITQWHVRNDVIETAITQFNNDKNNDIKSNSGLFVYKLKTAIENKNIERKENERKNEEYENAI